MARPADSPAVPSEPAPDVPTASPTAARTCWARPVSDWFPLSGPAVFVWVLYAVSVEIVERNWLAALTRDWTVAATLEPSGDTVTVTGVVLTDTRLTVMPGRRPDEGVGLGGDLIAPRAADRHDSVLRRRRGEEGAES